MQVSSFSSRSDAHRWDAFVNAHPDAMNYHRWAWKPILEDTFGWQSFYLAAEDAGSIRGVLPLVYLHGRFGTNALCSMPFLGECGIISQSEAIDRLLLKNAIDLAESLDVEYLELRHRRDHHLGLTAKTNKVTVMRPVHSDVDKMWSGLDTKIRTKIRKSIKAGSTAEFGGSEFLDDFYRVFSENMRDLGTPVYSRGFFAQILRSFPEEAFICRVYCRNKLVAVSFLLGFRETLEAKWSSSLREFLYMKPNMFLYWNLFCFAAQRGYQVFDFGRSTIGSGTHAFKMQWAESKPIPLHWDFWLPAGKGLPERNPENPKYRLAIGIWQRLPLAVTSRMGPRIVRYFP
jgi:serine/alanine adding enzyme